MSNITIKSAGNQSKTFIAALVLIPLFLLVLLLYAAGAGQSYAQNDGVRSHHVDVFQVEMQSSYQRKINAVGRVESTQQAIMGFERSGTLQLATVDDGASVEKGQLLAQLDDERLQAQRSEASATVERAKADARLAKVSEKRIERLVKDKLESQQRLDEAREQAASAQAFVTQVEASLLRIDVELQKSKIYAPFDGTVITRHVDPGSVVNLGQSVFILQEKGAAEARFAMGADQAFQLNVGDEFALQVPALTRNSQSRASVNATVKSISNARNLNTRTVDVIFRIQDDAFVLSGDLVTLSLPQTINESGVWLPKSALASGVRGLWTVYTVSGAGDERKIIPKFVSILYHTADHAYVSGTLVEGDFVVVQGVHRLVPGQVVGADIASVEHIASR